MDEKTKTLKEYFALQKSDGTHIRLTTTTKAEIEQHVKSENLFAIFDEMRTTGTDVNLADDGIFLNTVNQIPMDKALQGSIRARKIFKDQTNEFIVTKKGRKEMVNQGKDLDSLFLTFAKNEAKNLKDQEDAARLGQVDNYILAAIMKKLLKASSGSEINGIAKRFERFLVDTYEDEPYQQYGRIEGTAPAHEVLPEYAKNRLKQYKATEAKDFAVVEEEINKLLTFYKDAIPLMR
ncbi:MAG: hypothetical protein HWD61_06280 [Parachlamydiaceae bacterium]|nr:MAG: hypothetical protein HWD61_06280 [Parachlamydiaceae bacterium]